MKQWILTMLLASSCFAGSSQVFHELRANADHDYGNISLMPAYYHGWFRPDNQNGLNHFISTRKPQVVIEVGSWLGSSCIFMAQRMQPGTQLYAIDHFEGSIQHREQGLCTELLPTLYQQFLSNVIRSGTHEIIIPVRKDSETAFEHMKGRIKADLIYIDGDHATDAVYKDLTMYSQLLEEGGILCGDDWDWDTVRVAVERFAHEQGKEIIVQGSFWYLSP